MAIAIRPPKPVAPTAIEITGPRATTEQVWQQLDSASFAVISYVSPAGEPRSSGVVYKTAAKGLYIAVAPDSWKARHIASGAHVSVTVPVHRGGILALALPIPPATISFQATAHVHPAGSLEIGALSMELESLIPTERRDAAVIIELIPKGHFLTFGVGVSLMEMRKPELARAVVPVAAQVASAGR
ncbi:MAG TPA: pyridoxamine 5'-phosphate oxidase family protein [Clostridia bacterium]|nr:pyridoxamine 5'-phosphate oxidase family protein [Clostridia bacterium]